MRLKDIPELPEDIQTRPDGTPGNLTAYAPKVPVVTFIPREAPIMVALATRPKPWRMVNVPKDQAPIATGDVAADTNPPAAAVPEPERQAQRGPVDLRERIFTGDALARFAATRFDPDAPIEAMQLRRATFPGGTGIDQHRRRSLGRGRTGRNEAAHPEGKPIVTFRYGTKPPPSDPPRHNGPPLNEKPGAPPTAEWCRMASG